MIVVYMKTPIKYFLFTHSCSTSIFCIPIRQCGKLCYVICGVVWLRMQSWTSAKKIGKSREKYDGLILNEFALNCVK